MLMLNVSKRRERPGTTILSIKRIVSTTDNLNKAAAHWMNFELSSLKELTSIPKAADAKLSIVKHPNNF